jgi:hypothetical protein
MAGERELTLRLPQLQEWVTDLYWEYDRMSSSGKETLNKLADKVGVSTEDRESVSLYEEEEA